MNNKIPKIIHQIWLQGENNIPIDYPNYSASWKNLNPEFKYILWDENMIINLINNKFPKFLNVFNNYPKLVQKVDAAKYLIIYVYGGIYVDMDLECLKPIYELIENKQIILFKCDINILMRMVFYYTTNNILQNCFLVSIENHPFWLYIIDLMMKEDLKQGEYELLENYIFRTTGPGLLSNAYYTYPYKNNFTIIESQLIEPLSSCQYDAYNCSNTDCTIKVPESYAFHHFGAKHATHGWLSNKGKKVFQVFCTNQNSSIFICICIVLLIFIIIIIYTNFA